MAAGGTDAPGHGWRLFLGFEECTCFWDIAHLRQPDCQVRRSALQQDNTTMPPHACQNRCWACDFNQQNAGRLAAFSARKTRDSIRSYFGVWQARRLVSEVGSFRDTQWGRSMTRSRGHMEQCPSVIPMDRIRWLNAKTRGLSRQCWAIPRHFLEAFLELE